MISKTPYWVKFLNCYQKIVFHANNPSLQHSTWSSIGWFVKIKISQIYHKNLNKNDELVIHFVFFEKILTKCKITKFCIMLLLFIRSHGGVFIDKCLEFIFFWNRIKIRAKVFTHLFPLKFMCPFLQNHLLQILLHTLDTFYKNLFILKSNHIFWNFYLEQTKFVPTQSRHFFFRFSVYLQNLQKHFQKLVRDC